MRFLRGVVVLVALLSPPAARQQGEALAIEMTAKKYEFAPGEIRVKKGTRVQLRIRALDRSHGFGIRLYPEGAKEEGPPGLRFSNPQKSWKIEKEQTQVVEFTAERPGAYAFRCANFCGLGHGGMKGKLIVED